MWEKGDRPWATWLNDGVNSTAASESPRFKSDSPGIGRGSHPGDWVHYRSI